MNLSALNEILKNEPAFRMNQVKKALFQEFKETWHEVTNLSLSLRDVLADRCDLSITAQMNISKDGRSEKALITLADGAKVETVLMRHGHGTGGQGASKVQENGDDFDFEDDGAIENSGATEGSAKESPKGRNTVCVSSQVGCPLACEFCATGKLGFTRDLTTYEILEQVIFWARLLKKEGAKIRNIVFMGMGEPLLNYDNVLAAVKLLNDQNAFGLAIRHISISTAGIVENIRKFADEKMQVNLAISFHAPDDELRRKLMPIARKYTINELLDAVNYYVKKTNRRVMFEYIMLSGVNDTEECAIKLAKLMSRPLYFVNLINYNPTGVFKPSSGNHIKIFKDFLVSKGVVVTERFRFGTDIDAACGQLACKKY
ncbi:MAG: hypothetical protein US89_C0008G0021 [Candidatus Peregrinibacteria bacterium GW2011_GWF2_38_29]|nr:MAG: hypothetical protein US89_C0008G0021 [Candidatus Peregrinibacteria bacterium GW2011_GWF2_38_29]HBB03168.1 23S rRNA (adenine(2503)-C(2))-methyltransferase RlmN [Candidatus Peregrinibacteria bacterium]